MTTCHPTYVIAAWISALTILAGAANVRSADIAATNTDVKLRLTLRSAGNVPCGIGRIEVKTADGWRSVATGGAGGEFSTSLGDADASSAKSSGSPDSTQHIELVASTDPFDASETIDVDAHLGLLRRNQTYRFRRAGDVAIHPGFRVSGKDDPSIRYTYPVNVYEAKLADVPALRTSASWAVPMPAHVWSTKNFVCVYGVDRREIVSRGTLDVSPDGAGGLNVRAYLPDESAAPPPQGLGLPEHLPTKMHVDAGQSITIREFLRASPLENGADPLWEACRLTAGVMLAEQPTPPLDWQRVAGGISDFYEHCELWNPDAIGVGRGFFSNMWVHTTAGAAAKVGDSSGVYDIGWGEGYQVRTINALTRYWKRTGRGEGLRFVDEMTRNLELFRRSGDGDQPLYDRCQAGGIGMGDFAGVKRVWTHGAAAVGFELLDAYEAAPDYPKPQTRQTWLATARSIGGFLAKHQREDGDLQDGFDLQDHEINRKSRRIAARAIACGLWTKLARLSGDDAERAAMLECAKRLAKRVGPEIERLEFYNEMIDTHPDGLASQDYPDAEGAVYALDGLAELYVATRDPALLALCRRCAAFALTWTYFYDLPTGHDGHLRGVPVCRMPDYPIVYPGAGAEAVRPLIAMSRVTSDPLYRTMAREMLDGAARFQWTATGKPWTGGIIDAIDQNSGKHWGPNREGQVNSGMITAMTLTAAEIWMNDEDVNHHNPTRR